MYSMKSILPALVAASSMLLFVTAKSQAEEPNFYLSGSVNYTNFELSDESKTSQTELNESGLGSFNSVDSDAGFKFGIGMPLNENFAFEFSYVDFGQFGFKGDIDHLEMVQNHRLEFSGFVNHLSTAKAFELAIVASYPLSENASVYFRGAATQWNIETTTEISIVSEAISLGFKTEDGDIIKEKDTGSDGAISVGTNYKLSDVNVFLEAQNSYFDGASFFSLQLGTQYYF